MGRHERQRGASFERAVASELHAALGINFRRNLSQTQERALGDLTPDDDDFPFLIECKSRQNGADCHTAWMTQAVEAAEKAHLHPVVIYRIKTQPWRCRVWFSAIAEACGGEFSADMTADLPVASFCELAREIMARRKEMCPS